MSAYLTPMHLVTITYYHCSHPRLHPYCTFCCNFLAHYRRFSLYWLHPRSLGALENLSSYMCVCTFESGVEMEFSFHVIDL